MERGQFVLTTNGSISTLVDKWGLEEARDTMSKVLSRMDGEKRFSVCVWRLPDGVIFDKARYSTMANEYMQAAGSNEQLTVEVRYRHGETYRQVVLGRGPGESDRDAVMIAWPGGSVEIAEHELWNAESAVGLFVSYMEDGAALPPDVATRELDL